MYHCLMDAYNFIDVQNNVAILDVMTEAAHNEFNTLVDRFAKLKKPARHIVAFIFVRDIAYGDIGSRDPFNVLSQKKGTCSGKHALLKLLLTALDYDVQSWFAQHNFGAFPFKKWPVELQEFKGKDIRDYHDFLKVKIDNKWLTIDAVFDQNLRRLGLPVEDWDGQSDMKIPVDTKGIFIAEGDMEEHKQKMISQLPEEMRQERKRFLSALTKWLDEARTNN